MSLLSRGAKSAGEARYRLTAARSSLVSQHLELVRLHLQRRVHLPSEPKRDRETEDLYQEGYLGLVHAAMAYDASRDGAFGPYALARIRRAVHRAIYERFATVRIPLNTIERYKAANGLRTDRSILAQLWHPRVKLRPERRAARKEAPMPPAEAPFGGGDRADSGTKTVAQHLRTKHKIALAAAIDRLAVRCRRANARPAIEAIAAERVAIPSARERTPLRAMAKRFGVSVGRISVWQRGIQREAKGVLAEDGEFALLKRASARSPAADDCIVDDQLAAELAQARLKGLQRAFAVRDPLGRAWALLILLQRAGRAPADEAAAIFVRLPCGEQRSVLGALYAGRGDCGGEADEMGAAARAS